jgi:hypothetical protein
MNAAPTCESMFLNPLISRWCFAPGLFKGQIICLRCRGNKVIGNFNLSIFSVVQTLDGDEFIRVDYFQTFQKALHLRTSFFIFESLFAT